MKAFKELFFPALLALTTIGWGYAYQKRSDYIDYLEIENKALKTGLPPYPVFYNAASIDETERLTLEKTRAFYRDKGCDPYKDEQPAGVHGSEAEELKSKQP